EGQWTWRDRAQNLLHVPYRRVADSPTRRRFLPGGQFELLEADRGLGSPRLDLPAERLHAETVADGVTGDGDHVRRLAGLPQHAHLDRPLRAEIARPGAVAGFDLRRGLVRICAGRE